MRIAASHQSQQQCSNNNKIGEDLPFSPQKSHGTFGNIFTDFLHAARARILFFHPGIFDKGVKQSKDSSQRNEIDQFIHKFYHLNKISGTAKIGENSQKSKKSITFLFN